MADDKFQAIRASCDRCRAQKLKCIPRDSVSANGDGCQRCHRVKVQCTYSPRARARRGPGVASLQRTRAGDMRHASAERISNETEGAGGAAMRLEATATSTAEAMTIPATTDFEPAGAMDHLISASAPMAMISPSSSAYALDSESSTSLESAFGGQLLSLEELMRLSHEADVPGMGHPYSPFEDSTGGTHQQHFQLETPETVSSSPEHVRLHSTVDSMRRLSSLLTDMHECWERIQTRKRSGTKAGHMVEDYPMGDILCLAQEFAQAMEPLSNTEHATSPNTTNTHWAPEPFPSRDSSAVKPILDTPMALLVLSCYVSLVRMLNTVFEDIYEYLVAQPNAVQVGCGAISVRGLRLGQLPQSNEAHTQVYTVVNTLQHALQHCENLLGLPAEVKCTEERGARGANPEGEAFGLYEVDTSGISGDYRSVLSRELVMAMARQESDLIGTGGYLQRRIKRLRHILRHRMGL